MNTAAQQRWARLERAAERLDKATARLDAAAGTRGQELLGLRQDVETQLKALRTENATLRDVNLVATRRLDKVIDRLKIVLEA